MAIAISPLWISYTIFARRKTAGTPNLVRRALSLSAQGGGAKRRDGFGERSTAHRHYADRNEGEPGGTPGSASRDSVPAAHAAVEIHPGSRCITANVSRRVAIARLALPLSG